VVWLSVGAGAETGVTMAFRPHAVAAAGVVMAEFRALVP